MYDGAVRADQFEGGEGFVGGGGERFSQKTGLPMGMTDCSRARLTRVLGADDIPVDVVSGQHGRQVATVLGAALGCEALTTIDDIVVDDDQVAVVVVSDVLQETFGVNVGSGQQGEVDQSGLRVCS